MARRAHPWPDSSINRQPAFTGRRFRRDSFDYLVGTSEQPRRNFEPDRLGGFEVDDQLELSWLLDRQFLRFCTSENLVDIVGSNAKLIGQTGTVGQKSTGLDVFTPREYDRQSRVPCEIGNVRPAAEEKGVGESHSGFSVLPLHANERVVQFRIGRNINRHNLPVQMLARG